MNLLNGFKYIFSDFDGTISKHDVIHSFIKNFAEGDPSIAEKKWAAGKISTDECMKIQLELIKNLKKEEFFEFLYSIEIDNAFVDFYNFVKRQNKKIIILSDGFDIFIESTLKKYNIFDIPIWANKLDIKEKNDFLQFTNLHPNKNNLCKISSGCCKCEVAQKYAKDYVYIGDGLSDRCIAKHASLLFAKNGLETFCKKENISYFPYKTFQDIINATEEENCNAADDAGFNFGRKN